MRTQACRWFLSLIVVAAVVAACVALDPWSRGASPPRGGPTLAEAVARTLATGSARVEATLTPRSGPAIDIRGVTSFRGPAAEITAGVGPRGSDAATVRVTADGRAWLRPPGVASWTAIDPSVTGAVADAQGWADLLGRLEPSDQRSLRGARSATVDGDPAAVWLDGAGRIRRVRLERRATSATLDLRLRDLGTEVVVLEP